MIKTLCASNAWGAGSVPGQRTKMPHALWPNIFFNHNLYETIEKLSTDWFSFSFFFLYNVKKLH